jgi:biopolymer transport protein ExbB/TolQ
MIQIRKFVAGGDYKRAIALCQRFKEKALPQIVFAGLMKANKMKTPKQQAIQNAVDESTLEVIPRLQARTGFLAMIGNISTLTGLMGTIFGLIYSFRVVGSEALKPDERAGELARGISVAMNTTLFGLGIAIPAILVYTVLRNKTNKIIDEIDEHTVRLINLITEEE